MRGRALVIGTILAATLAVGCAGTHQQTGMSDSDYVPPMSIYSMMDSTSLVYSDPAAASPINDHPLRWIAFSLYPVGQALDYGLNRPIYWIGSHPQYLFGYTSEDSMLDSQRR